MNVKPLDVIMLMAKYSDDIISMWNILEKHIGSDKSTKEVVVILGGLIGYIASETLDDIHQDNFINNISEIAKLGLIAQKYNNEEINNNDGN